MSYKHVTAGSALAALLAVSAPHLIGQAAPAAPDTANADDEETIVLSPFTIEAGEDTSGYQATSTLAGTRVKTDLRDVASSISIVTKKFLQDTGATGNESLLQYTAGTEVGGIYGNFGGVTASSGQYSESGVLQRPSTNTRVRGLDAADNTRDYFLTEIPWDSYIVDRVDLQRGPNSILFGVGSPAGIINTSLNTASFKRRYSLENRVDEHGSLRNVLDLNHVLIKQELALRFVALDERNKYQQKPAFENDRRYFAALRYNPKLFGAGNTTDIRVNYEHGTIDANRPRILPPVDAITPWFFGATDPYGNPGGLNKRTFRPDYRPTALENANPWVRSTPGRQFWPGTVGYYAAIPRGAAPGTTATSGGNGLPAFFQSPMGGDSFGIGPTFNTGTGSWVDGTIGGAPFVRPWAITNFDEYTRLAANLSPTAPGYIPGGSYYTDRSLADPSIFNFYENLIDGDNKREWQKWDAANVAFSQTFLDSRLGIEVVYDAQRYHEGQKSILEGGGTYQIGIDVNSHLSDGSVNPNAGRPFVAGSTEGGNNLTDIDRDSVRGTLFAELRSEDFLRRDSRLAWILGKHRFTGLLSQDRAKQFRRSWVQDIADASYPTLMGEPQSIANHVNAYNWQYYLGPSLANASSASGANLDRINTIITSPTSAQVRYFNSSWKFPLTPGAAGYVDPNSPFTYTDVNGVVNASTQSENPANYVGWTDTTVNFRNAERDGMDGFWSTGSRTERRIKSRGITWQGFLMDGMLVPVFGWRKDEVRGKQGDASVDSNSGLANLNFDYDDTKTQFVSGESKSWGAVFKMPNSLRQKLPGRTGIDVFFNRSENFKADSIRENVFGFPIANPTGNTKEHGVVINTLDDKLSLKVTWYETKVASASLPGDTGFNYLHWAVPAWGVAHVAHLQAGLRGENGGNSWLWDYTPNGTTTAQMQAIVDAWKALPLTQQFFNSYGRELAEINVGRVQAGDFTGAWQKWSAGRADPQPGSSVNRVAAGGTTSKGLEFELYAQPTRNWNLTANVTKTEATISEVSPDIADYMDSMTQFLAGAAGDLRIWGPGGATFRQVWADEALTRYNILLSQIGQSAAEISPWRVNLITSYNFDHGAVKGLFVGGGYRWEDKRIMRYKFDATTNSLDTNQPIYGPSEDHFDLWVGYTRKVFGKYDWRIQVNVRNVGEDDHLVPISYQPNGDVALSRIQEGMTWQLTNSFSF